MTVERVNYVVSLSLTELETTLKKRNCLNRLTRASLVRLIQDHRQAHRELNKQGEELAQKDKNATTLFMIGVGLGMIVAFVICFLCALIS